MAKNDEPTPEQKKAWDAYIRAQAENKKRQEEVMKKLEEQMKDDEKDDGG